MNRKQAHKDWQELPEEYRENVVDWLKDQLGAQFFVEMREHFEQDPEEWWAKDGWHFSRGMQIRNLLREGGFTDDQLGENGNWDDYYIQALEEAAGIAP